MAKLKFKEKNPGTIAVVGIVGMLAVIFGAFYVAGLPFIAGHRYQAVFDEAGGLNVGDKVKVAGVEAGQVTDVTLENGDVVVTFTIRDVSLGDESVAKIGTQTLLGERNLVLTSRGGGELSPGDRIPLSRTKSPYSITQGIDDLTRRTGEIDKEQLTEALDVFSEAFENTPEHFAEAFAGVSRISKTISSRDEALRELMKKARSVSGTLSERSEQLKSLITDGNALLRELQSRRQVISALLRDATKVAEQVVALNKEQRDRLAPTLRSLNKTIDVLRRNEDNIGTAVNRVSTFITGLGEGLEHGTSFTGYGELGGLGVFPTAQFIPALTLPLPDGRSADSPSANGGK